MIEMEGKILLGVVFLVASNVACAVDRPNNVEEEIKSMDEQVNGYARGNVRFFSAGLNA